MMTSRKSFSYERKQNELKQNTALRLRVLRSVLAAGFALSPWLGASDAWAEGSMITRVNDKDKNLMQNGRADIFAESASGNVGLNRFEQFIVGNNDIANMYFKTHEGSLGFDTLVNTVKSRIDIYGTVNALRNNKIGGNMYFLSPKGMVVGAGGVINAGSLTVLTSGKTFDNASEAEKAIKKNSWSLNPSASIDIHGTVNAATGIDLRAAYINVTKAADATQGPLLRTGVVFDTTVPAPRPIPAAASPGGRPRWFNILSIRLFGHTVGLRGIPFSKRAADFVNFVGFRAHNLQENWFLKQKCKNVLTTKAQSATIQ